MALAPLIAAPTAVLVHLITVVPTAVIGAWLILGSRKGARWHRRLGYVFLGLMTVTAISTVFVRDLNDGAFSWIHLLIPLTLFGVAGGLYAARRHNVQRHRQAMLSLYLGALVVAGAFTLLPGRLLYRVLLG
ncbi:hypothetical protein BAL199_18526 [alpha proteobacterium BAL199]|jgi:uncharacterized membrane protein|nr:hypothetical protein BAL199_18526 [alpha proteobacterium BAL199]